jgi:hypothetical protein
VRRNPRATSTYLSVHFAHERRTTSLTRSAFRPEPGDDHRVLNSSDIVGFPKKDDNPVLITCTKEKAGVLGSGL